MPCSTSSASTISAVAYTVVHWLLAVLVSDSRYEPQFLFKSSAAAADSLNIKYLHIWPWCSWMLCGNFIQMARRVWTQIEVLTLCTALLGLPLTINHIHHELACRNCMHTPGVWTVTAGLFSTLSNTGRWHRLDGQQEVVLHFHPLIRFEFHG